MSLDPVRHDRTPDARPHAAVPGVFEDDRTYHSTAELVLDDLLISMGQTIGLRTSIDYDAVVWIHEHFHPRFVMALQEQGDRYLDDRAVVSAVAGLFAERAVRYAGDAPSITVDHVRQAAADVERYCRAHAQRAAARRAADSEGATALIAGYWCTWDPEKP